MQVTRSSHLNSQETTRAHFENGVPSYTGNSLRSMQEKSNEKRSSCSVFWGKVKEGLTFLLELFCCCFCYKTPKVWTKQELVSYIDKRLFRSYKKEYFESLGFYEGLFLCKVGDKELRKFISDTRTYSVAEDIEGWISSLKEEDLRGVVKWVYVPLKENKLPEALICFDRQEVVHTHHVVKPIPIDSSEKLWKYVEDFEA